MADDSWRTATFRQSVVSKIDEAIRQSRMPTSRNSMEMENHVFQKAKTKEEYLGFVARLILHVREMNAQGNPSDVDGFFDRLVDLPNNWKSEVPLEARFHERNKIPENILLPTPSTSSQSCSNSSIKRTRENDQEINVFGQVSKVLPKASKKVDEYKAFGIVLAAKLRQMNNKQRIYCEHIINEAVYKGLLGELTQNSMISEVPHFESLPRNSSERVGFSDTKKGNEMNGPGSVQGAPGMPDPINALQNLASQGSRNNQMMGMAGPQSVSMGGPQQMPPISATNLLQNLNRGPGQGIGNMQGNVQARPTMVMGNNGPMPNQMGGQLSGQLVNQLGGQMGGQMQGQIPNTTMGQMSGQLQSQLQNQLNSQLQGQVGGPLGNQVPNQLQGQLQNQLGNNMQGGMSASMGGGNQIPNQLQNQMQNQLPNQMLGQLQQQMQRKPTDNMMMNAPNSGFPRNSTPNQFLTQSPTSSVQSPASLSGPPPSNQMVASPALVHSPGSQMGLMAGPQRSVGMAPSPSSSLNTPGQPGQSPMGMQEDQAYREKVRQLSKYIEPLRKMIARMGNDGEHVEKLSKMKKLLEILSNPSQRMPLETLIKCEVVLEKLDFNKRGDGSVAPPAHSMTFKEHHCFNPILEAVNNNLQSSVINHTLHRTFGPTLEALFGPEIRLVPPLKRKKIEEPTSEIPDVLQGEIARLDQRFKVSLDPSQQPGSKTIQLLCWLDDKHLPCVPPVSLIIPEDYPKSSPKCHMAPHEYNATQFLSAVQNALLARIKKLPKHFSVSQLLDTWEMSVRQASAPSHIPISTTTLLMGL